MSSRPRRSAAQRATAAITDLADRDNNDRTMSSSRRRAAEGAKPGVTIVSRSNNPNSSPGDDSGKHIHLTVKVPSSKLRQATSGGSSKTGASSAIVAKGADAYGGGRRAARAGKKSYVVESDSDEEEDDDDDDDAVIDEDDEEEEEDEIQVGTARPAVVDDDDDDAEAEDEEMEQLGDEDAEGEEADDDIMDVDRYQDDNDDEALVGDDGYGDDDDDAEGEDDDDALGDEDADGDVDMDTPAPPPPTIKISRPSKSSVKAKPPAPAKKASGKSKAIPQKSKPSFDDEDDELSELESDPDDVNDTVKVGGEEDAEGEDDDMDAEGEEIEVADEDALGEDDDGLGSDDDTAGGGSRAETPDMSRMTARQRAKHGDVIQEYMKLSDEVQVKKHFTAEELSMRRAEMARRRRNLSEKRNEEVKMETINKLLKKQAPKTNRRVGHLPGEDTPPEFPKPNPVFVRWVSSQKGSIVAVPEEIVEGPAGRVFVPGGLGAGKMVEEVS